MRLSNPIDAPGRAGGLCKVPRLPGPVGRAVQSPTAPTRFAQLSHRPLGNRSGDFRSRLENAPEDLRVSHTSHSPDDG